MYKEKISIISLLIIFSAVILKLSCAHQFLGMLIKGWFWFSRSRVGPGFCISHKLQGNADVAVSDQHQKSKNLAPTFNDMHNYPRAFLQYLATNAFSQWDVTSLLLCLTLLWISCGRKKSMSSIEKQPEIVQGSAHHSHTLAAISLQEKSALEWDNPDLRRGTWGHPSPEWGLREGVS